MKLKIAAINWGIRSIRWEQAFWDHLDEVVGRANGAHVIVLPELFLLELLGVIGSTPESEQVAALSQYAEPLKERLTQLSKSLNAVIVGGSHFDHERHNVCSIHFPNGETALQTKINLTQYESQTWKVAPGCDLVPLPLPQLGTLICYDCEFPEAARQWADAGVTLLTVPTFTESLHGFWRVRNSCLARAVENQIFVVQSSLVGDLGGEPVPETHGSSAIIAPMVSPFPADGILAESLFNQESVASAEVDFNLLESARLSGDVRNWNDRNNSRWQIKART